METATFITSRTTHLAAAGASHPGRVRELNEDRFICDAERGILAVIDGVGGAKAGEVAAEMARHILLERLARPEGSAEERLREAVALANNEIHADATTSDELSGMACVLTVVLVEEGRLTAAHVGDTRLYLLHAGTFRKLTPDHSPVGMQEDAGTLTEAQAMQHPRRNEIYRDVGSGPRDPYEPDFIEIVRSPFPRDAVVLLCSDGLTDLVPAGAIRRALEQAAGRPEEAVKALVRAANEAGGKDNVTVVVAEGAAFAEAERRRAQAPPAAPAAMPAAPPPARPSSPTSASAPAPARRRGGLGWLVAFLVGVAVGLVLLTLGQQFLSQELGPVEAPRTLHVAEADAAYTTIAEALAAARPGDRVEVAPGTYTGGLTVPPGVRLTARTPRTVHLQPAGPTDSVALRVGAGAHVSGLRIAAAILADTSAVEAADTLSSTRAGAVAFVRGVVVEGAEVVLEELDVEGVRDAGVVFSRGSGGVLRASRIAGNGGVGIVLEGAAEVRLVHNLILRNGHRQAPQPGLRADSGAVPMLEGNVFQGNTGGAVTPASRTAALTERNVLLPMEDAIPAH